MSVAEILSKAADLIEPEGAWTQGEYARNAKGRALAAGYRKGAVCWCAIGAMERVTGGCLGTEEPKSLLQRVVGVYVHDWNDAPERTQAEVVAKLREAAALSKASGDR